jgi:hypothetical protein
MPINYEKLTEVVREKVSNIVASEMEMYGGAQDVKIEIEITDDFIFCTSHCYAPKMVSYSHRYGMYCYSALGFTLYAHDSNVIDRDKFKTLQDTKQWSKNLFTHLAKAMQQYI